MLKYYTDEGEDFVGCQLDIGYIHLGNGHWVKSGNSCEGLARFLSSSDAICKGLS